MGSSPCGFMCSSIPFKTFHVFAHLVFFFHVKFKEIKIIPFQLDLFFISEFKTFYLRFLLAFRQATFDALETFKENLYFIKIS